MALLLVAGATVQAQRVQAPDAPNWEQVSTPLCANDDFILNNTTPIWTLAKGSQAGQVGISDARLDMEPLGPEGLAVDEQGIIYIVDSLNQRIIGFNPLSRQTFTLDVPDAGYPADLMVRDGSLYILDATQNAVLKLNQSGIVQAAYSGPNEVRDQVTGIAVSSAGDLQWQVDYRQEYALAVTALSPERTSAGFQGPTQGLSVIAGQENVARVTSARINDHTGTLSIVGVNEVPQRLLNIEVEHYLGSATLLRIDTDGNYYVLVEEVLENVPAFVVDVTVRRFSAEGVLTGVAQVPIAQTYALPQRYVAINSRGEVYYLHVLPGSAQVVQLPFVANYHTDLKERWAVLQTDLLNQEAKALGMALPASPQGTLTRDQIMQNAQAYLNVNWVLGAANYHTGPANNWNNCYPTATENWRLPRYLAGRLNQTIAEVPYAWGKADSIASFLTHISQNYWAGNICGNPVLSNVAGVDCSGFVSQAWQLGQHYGTGQLPNLSTAIAWNELRRGDIANKASSHVTLFSFFLNGADISGGIRNYEARGDWADRVIEDDRSYADLNGFVPRRYNNVIEDPVCYSLTLSVNPGNAGSITTSPMPNCGNQYTTGTVVQLTASANAGFTFANWSGDASGTANSTTVSMTGAKSVTANFSNGVVCPTITDWLGEYWNNQEQSGSPALCRNDFALDFDWGYGSPDPVISTESFSARWTRTVNFPAGSYRFHVLHDDGARLLIDGVTKIDAWGTCCVWDTADVTLGNGNHTVRVDMVERAGAAYANVWWERLDILGWRGEYYNNESLSNSPVIVRDDGANLNFEWQYQSPDPLVQPDHFSARWTRSISFAAGSYRFDVFHDDGARLYIDDALIFENWCGNCRQTDSVTVTLATGTHNIKMETREVVGGAAAALSWSSPVPNDDFSSPKQISNFPYANSMDTANATTASDDPTLCAGGVGSASVWFRYTPSSSGLLTVDTIGSNYDTVVAVWTGVRGSLYRLACNDDFGGNFTSAASANLNGGTIYYLEVTRYGAGLGLDSAKKSSLNSSPDILAPSSSGGNLQLSVKFTPKQSEPPFGYGFAVGAWDTDRVQSMGFNWVMVFDPPHSREPVNVLLRLKAGASDLNDLAAFTYRVQQIAIDYGSNIDAYEIGNEVNLNSAGWSAPPNAADYAQVLCTAYNAIKQADPTATVVSAGLAPTGRLGKTTTAQDERTFLAELIVAGGGNCLDAVGYHPMGFSADYDAAPDIKSSNPELNCENGFCFRGVEKIYEVMRDNGLGQTPVWATEIGWITAPLNSGCLLDPRWQGRTWQIVTSDKQANNLIGAFRYARFHWPWMGAMFIFNLNFNTAPYYDECEQMRYYSVQGAPAEATLSAMSKQLHRLYLPIVRR